MRHLALLLLLAGPVFSASPSWYTGITQGTWGTLPSSSLSASGVMQSGANLVDPWGGACVNSTGLYIGSTFTAGTWYILWGGGHADYGGNEVYAYGPLENDAPTWNRLRDRTEPYPENVTQDGSGNPPARHTYNSFACIDDGTKNWLITIGAAFRYTDGNSNNTVHRFNFAQTSPNSNMPWSNLGSAAGDADVVAWDRTTNRIWYHTINPSGDVNYYDVAANTHTSEIFKSPLLTAGGGSSALDTTRGLWFFWNSTYGISAYRTNNGVSNDYYTPSTTGTAPTGTGTILYDRASDAFKFWFGGGKTYWTLTPPGTNPYQGGNNWTWSSTTPGTGSTPTAQNSNGTQSRFQYVHTAAVRGYILLNADDESIYFLRTGAGEAGGGGGVAGRMMLLGAGK